MAIDRNFRAAINGFNRSDVVNYIEETAILHEKALRQLRDENARLQAEIEKLLADNAALEARIPAEPPQWEAPPEPEEEPEIAPDAAPAGPAVTELELETYRRAEAAERGARRRAAALCGQVNDIVTSASKQFEESGADVDALMTDLNICLRRLNDTFAELRLAFDDTAASLAAVELLEEE